MLRLPGKLARVLERVDGIDIFIPPNCLDSWKPQRQSAGVPSTTLNLIKSHLEHDIRRHGAVSPVISYRVSFEVLR